MKVSGLTLNKYILFARVCIIFFTIDNERN